MSYAHENNPPKAPVDSQTIHVASTPVQPDQQPQRGETELEQRMSAFERSTLRLTRAGLLVATLSGAVIALQWYEMRKGGVDTHDLAEAAKAQSDAARTIAESAKAQSENTAKLANFTSQEVTQLAASVKETHAATNRAESALQRSERPWVNAESLEGSFWSTGDGNLSGKVRIMMKNTGKSIATNGWVMVSAEPNSVKILNKEWHKSCDIIDDFKSAIAKSAQGGYGGNWPMGFVLAPGESVVEDIGIGNIKSDMADLNKQYLLGCAIYNDQFSKTHHTNFCFQVGGPGATSGSPQFKTCNAFQEAN